MKARWVKTRVLMLLVAALQPALAADAQFPAVTPGHEIRLPRDEGSHPQFRTEWWYLTGSLQTKDGQRLGFQITFFRSRPGAGEDNPSQFAPRQLLFAHVAVSDPRRAVLLRDEKSARAGFGLAEAAEGSLDVHIDDWSLRATGETYRATAQGPHVALDLELVKTQPPLLQGDRGFSQKGPEPQHASYYYSLPQLRTRGRVVLDGREQEVHGVAWFDHEWSSAIMSAAAQGWDWVGLNLDDGGALMAFRMRDAHGGTHWAAATARDGASTQAYSAGQIDWSPLRHWRSPRTGIRYPVEWKVAVGGRALTLRPSMDDQESDSRGSTGTIYWEGAVQAFDDNGLPVGRGYLELTGYGSRVKF